MSFTVCMVA